jgi:hypothetical protein
MEADVFGGLELDRQAFAEVAPDMYFEVPAVVVGQRPSRDQPSIRRRIRLP